MGLNNENNDKELAIFGGTPVRSSRIFYGKQSVEDTDIDAVVKVLKSDWLTQGPNVRRLEEMLCEKFGAKYAVASTNGTSALHLACIAAEIKPGDEVITTPMTFAASANCVRYCGGRVIFADICEDSKTIDPDIIESKITEKTKAVIAVDYAGQPAQLDRIRDICDRNGLFLIEDAAHSLGSTYKGRPIGSIADFTTFSFHPVKTITGGEGGAVLCSNKKYADNMKLAANHGITKDPGILTLPEKEIDPWYCEQILLGYNFRMTDIQAVLIISQAERLDQYKRRRKEILERYNSSFSQLNGLICPQPYYDSDPCWHLYVLRINPNLAPLDRRQMFTALAAENIQPQVHYVPVHLHPDYRALGHYKGECPVAEKIYEEILSLPLYPSMTNKDVEDVISAVHKVYRYYEGLV